MNIEDLRIIAFDLDDTLAESKSALEPGVGRVLSRLLEQLEVCIISGGRFEQFEAQVLDHLPADAGLSRLHLMPTCGTRYLRFMDDGWRQVYAHDLTDGQKVRAIKALESSARALGLWESGEKVRGDRIEDRGSQITFSALGQEALVAEKKAWDPDGSRREALRAAVAELLPDLEVRAGGSTSIDVTARGIDKAYGMRRLAEQTGIGLDDMLFVGDRLMPGGNDYPVAAMGVATHAVTGPADTVAYLENLITTLEER